jgi:hypothetical protein
VAETPAEPGVETKEKEDAAKEVPPPTDEMEKPAPKPATPKRGTPKRARPSGPN